MAQLPETVKVGALSELAESRRLVKRALKLVRELNAEIARAEARLLGLEEGLEEFGIRLEVEE